MYAREHIYSSFRPARASPASRAAAPRALAIAAHPDDIEFVMAGTLLLLQRAGWEIHYLNVANGNMGSLTIPPVKLAQTRRDEARTACRILGATWHAPICNDLEVFYENRTLRRVAAVIRTVEPTVILTHSPQDYMEDHMITARLAVTAAFARATPGYRTIPSRPPMAGPVTIYHASPHGMRDGLRADGEARRVRQHDSGALAKDRRPCLPREPAQMARQDTGDGRLHQDDGRIQPQDGDAVRSVPPRRGAGVVTCILASVPRTPIRSRMLSVATSRSAAGTNADSTQLIM